MGQAEAPGNRVTASLLGPTGFRLANGTMTNPLPRKSWGLFAYLCLSHGRSVPREELAALLWPQSSDRSGRASLRQELSVLRRGLEEVGFCGFDSTKDAVSMPEPAGVDALTLLRLPDTAPIEDMRVAADLCKGAFLVDLKLRSGPFEEWVWIERERLKNAAIRILTAVLKHEVAEGNRHGVIAAAERVLQVEPTQEVAYRALMRAHRSADAPIEALRWFRQCEDVLRRDLDTVPSLETRSLAEDIRQGPRNRSWSSIRLQRSWLVVAQASLTLPMTALTGADPDHVLQAQAKFGETFAKAVAQHEGHVIAGTPDRCVAVFEAGQSQHAALRAALDAMHSVVSQTAGISKDVIWWPRAGVAAGQMVWSPNNASNVIAGVPLMRAANAMNSARAGEVVVETSVLRGLPKRPESRAIIPYAPDPGLRVYVP